MGERAFFDVVEFAFSHYLEKKGEVFVLKFLPNIEQSRPYSSVRSKAVRDGTDGGEGELESCPEDSSFLVSLSRDELLSFSSVALPSSLS